MAPPNMKFALLNYNRSKLTEADHAHLERWLGAVEDPIWKQLADGFRKHHPNFEPYSWFISAALRLREIAESVESPAHEKARLEREERQTKIEMFAFAEKMVEVVRCYPAFEEFLIQKLPPDPDIWPIPSSDDELAAKQSLDWLVKNAGVLRGLAEKPSYGEPRLKVSRQAGGKNRRPQSRELGVFMRKMAGNIKVWCGKPSYNAVCAMTNIAFPDAGVVPEDVRTACKPTTRAGRLRKTGALR